MPKPIKLGFEIIRRVGLARAGRLITAHGEVLTPAFMPVGTQGTVKALTPMEVKNTQAQIILGNTYHLYLRPGPKIMEEAGGLHRFMRWPGPILTDSGGYQVSSLGLFKKASASRLTKVTEEGVTFKSHLDGSTHFMTPTLSIEMQQKIGSDIMMAFDEATPVASKTYAKEALVRTQNWLNLCIKQWQSEVGEHRQLLFGIIQGGDYRDLRRYAAEHMLQQPVSGLALGGATIGRSVKETAKNAAYVMDMISPDGRPIYFMGVGVNPSHAIGAVLAGADMFDCVAPTKLARCGLLYQGRLQFDDKDLESARFESEFEGERLNIEKKQFAADFQPIDRACDCETCQGGFTRAYLHHLYKARELLYYRLASIHNVRMMIRVVEELRQAIMIGR